MLTGHVVSSMLQAMLATGLVIGVALLIGFRPTAGALRWVEAIGVLAMVTFAFTWLAVALGLVSKTPETASNLPMPLLILPFLGRYLKEQQWSEAALGSAISLAGLGVFVMQTPAGLLVDRLRQRRKDRQLCRRERYSRR